MKGVNMKYLLIDAELDLKGGADPDVAIQVVKAPLHTIEEEMAVRLVIDVLDRVDSHPGDDQVRFEREARRKQRIANIFGRNIYITLVGRGEIGMAIVED
jgi:hypothetical protein